MGITYRGDGPWGSGKGSDLNPVDVDNNFWQLVQDTAAKAVQGVGIANFQVLGDQMTVVLTDHTLLGPYTLPTAFISFGGEWQPATDYFTNTILTYGGTTYIVMFNHTSAATFDPGANDGQGNDYYGILLEAPASTIATGGSPGMTLHKASAADYTTYWNWPTFLELHDVLQSPAPGTNDLVYWTGSAFSYISQAEVLGAPPNLRDLSDVLQSPAPATGDLVYWNGGAFSYVAQGNVHSAPQSQSLAGLSDVQQSPAPVDGQVVTWNGFASAFTYVTPPDPGSTTLGGLSDVSIGLVSYPLQDRDALVFDAASGKWVNRPVMTLTNWSSSGSQTLTIGDQYSLLDATGNPATLNIPLNASVPFSTSAIFGVRQASTLQSSITADAGVTLNLPPGRQAKTRAYGSVIWAQQTANVDTWTLYGDLAYNTPPTMPATGNFIVDPRINDQDVFAWTPVGNQTVTVAAGAVQIAKRVIFVITTAGTTSYTLTFGTGFKTQGTLATGVVSGKVFTITFIGDGTNFNEICRTTAM